MKDLVFAEYGDDVVYLKVKLFRIMPEKIFRLDFSNRLESFCVVWVIWCSYCGWSFRFLNVFVKALRDSNNVFFHLEKSLFYVGCLCFEWICEAYVAS